MESYKPREEFQDDVSYREQFMEVNQYYLDVGWEWCKIVELNLSIEHYLFAPSGEANIRVVHPESTTSNTYAIEDEIFIDGPDWLREHKDAHFCDTSDGDIDWDRYNDMRSIVNQNRKNRLEAMIA